MKASSYRDRVVDVAEELFKCGAPCLQGVVCLQQLPYVCRTARLHGAPEDLRVAGSLCCCAT